MAGKSIKGLTVEIGGDTTKLGKALENVEKKSKGLSSELGEINRLLKLDPHNTDLLAQKQKVLAEAISNTESRLQTLKDAEQQVQAQFERGEVSEQQYRALQREIIATERQLNGYQRAVEETEQATQDLDRETVATDRHMGNYERAVESTDGALQKLDDTTGEVEKSSGKLGQVLGTTAKAITTAVATAGVAMAGLTVKALELSGELEQNMGGSEAVFGEYADRLQKTAQKAYSTMGLSTSDYLATANKMGSLFQGAGFEVEESMNISARAMQRAADVASIMGIDTESAMESIAGAAKGNFTMMDNLGVAMNDTALQAYALEKGIKKATKEMSSQEKIGLAMEMFLEKTAYASGNYAKENETLAGSLGTAKSALTNFLDGSGDVDGMVSAFENLANVVIRSLSEVAPRLIEGLTEAVNKVIPLLPPLINQLLPVIIDGAVSLIDGLVSALPMLIDSLMASLPALIQGITKIVNGIIKALPQLIKSIVSALPALIPQLINGVVSMITTWWQSLPEMIQPIIDSLPEIITAISEALITNFPILLESAIQLFMALIEALPTIAEQLAVVLPELVVSIVSTLQENLPTLLDGAIQLFMALVEAIPIIAEALIPMIPQIVRDVISTLISNAPMLLDAGIQFFMALVKAVPEMLVALGTVLGTVLAEIVQWGVDLVAEGKKAAKDLFDTIVDGVKELPEKMLSIGGDLVRGLWNGITSLGSWFKGNITSFANGIIDGFKETFEIHSPSRKMAWMGEMLDEGLAQGVEKNAKSPIRAVMDLADEMLNDNNAFGGLAIERNVKHSFEPIVEMPTIATEIQSTGIIGKLDSILSAIERGQIIAIDGKEFVGKTVDAYDKALGERRLLAELGAR